MSEVIDLTGENGRAVTASALLTSTTAHNHDWKVVMLIDCQEHNNTTSDDQSLDQIVLEINRHFYNRNSVVDQVYRKYCEIGNSCHNNRKTLPAADYMFVARKINLVTREVVEEQVLDLIIERKTVADVYRSIVEESRRYIPLQRVEVQLRKLRYCGIPRKVVLMEGDEDTVHLTNFKPNQMPLESRRRAVKTLRMMLDNNEFEGIGLVCTRHSSDTIQYLKDQLSDVTGRFFSQLSNRAVVARPLMNFQQVIDNVENAMQDAAFQDYLLRRQHQPNVGDIRAERLVQAYAPSFVSPSIRSRRGTKSTLNNRATYYVSPSATGHNRQLARQSTAMGGFEPIRYQPLDNRRQRRDHRRRGSRPY